MLFLIELFQENGFLIAFRFWLGGAAPQTPRLNDRPQHLIEAAKRGRLDQMLFFSAPLTTRAPPTTVQPDMRPNVRLNARPNVSRLKRKLEKYVEKYFEQTLQQ